MSPRERVLAFWATSVLVLVDVVRHAEEQLFGVSLYAFEFGRTMTLTSDAPKCLPRNRMRSDDIRKRPSFEGRVSLDDFGLSTHFFGIPVSVSNEAVRWVRAPKSAVSPDQRSPGAARMGRRQRTASLPPVPFSIASGQFDTSRVVAARFPEEDPVCYGHSLGRLGSPCRGCGQLLRMRRRYLK